MPDLKNNSDGDKELLWSVLSKCDITNINTGELSYYIEMKKREKAILQEHIEKFYHIWKNNKGAYMTYLPAPNKPKGRKSVSALTQEKLEQKIIDFYEAERRKKELITLRLLYPKWLKYKELETTASTYIRRIDVDWKKYYLVDPIIDMDITK